MVRSLSSIHFSLSKKYPHLGFKESRQSRLGPRHSLNNETNLHQLLCSAVEHLQNPWTSNISKYWQTKATDSRLCLTKVRYGPVFWSVELQCEMVWLHARLTWYILCKIAFNQNKLKYIDKEKKILRDTQNLLTLRDIWNLTYNTVAWYSAVVFVANLYESGKVVHTTSKSVPKQIKLKSLENLRICNM